MAKPSASQRRSSASGSGAQRAAHLASATERGTRVFLRPPTRRDRAEFLGLRQASRAFHRPWEPRPAPGFDPCGDEAFTRYLARARATNCDYSLVCRVEDGAIVGVFNLSNVVPAPFECGFLGYWAGAPYAGQGYMAAGLQLFLRRAFRALKLHRVEANICPENEPSLALVRRAGFVREGFSRRYLKIAGRWRDHERWALLREDWKPVRTLS